MFLRRTPRRAHALQNTANEGSRRSLVRADRQSQIQRYSTGVVRPSSLHWQMSVVLRRTAMPLNESYHEEKLGRHRASSSYNVFRSEARAEMPAVKGTNKLCEPAQTTAPLGPRAGHGPFSQIADAGALPFSQPDRLGRTQGDLRVRVAARRRVRIREAQEVR